MRKPSIVVISALCFSLLACETTNTDEWLKVGQDIYGQVAGKPLTQQEIAAGLKQALEVGTNNVASGMDFIVIHQFTSLYRTVWQKFNAH